LTNVESILDVKYLTEARNNVDASAMSFGIGVFVTPDCYDLINMYYPYKLHTFGNGCIAIGIEFMDGSIVWVIHYPLDFRNKGEENLGAKTMVASQEMMLNFPNSVCCFGDMNIIQGMIEESIVNAIQNDFKLAFGTREVYTFVGSYFDTLPMNENEEYVSVLEMPISSSVLIE
jgi:hypothetical protein